MRNESATSAWNLAEDSTCTSSSLQSRRTFAKHCSLYGPRIAGGRNTCVGAEFRPNFGKFDQIWQILTTNSRWFLGKIGKPCAILKFGAVQKCADLVDLKKCSKMSIHLQTSASIRPRTNPPKLYSYTFSYHMFWSTNVVCQGRYCAAWEGALRKLDESILPIFRLSTRFRRIYPNHRSVFRTHRYVLH